jgi:hypothetical protein
MMLPTRAQMAEINAARASRSIHLPRSASKMT